MRMMYTEDEEQRLSALREYRVLYTPADEIFNSLTRLAAHICGTPIAVMSLIDRERQWFKAKIGIELQEIPRDIGVFCAQTILQPDFFIVPDALSDELYATSALVENYPHARFYAGVPLVTPQGYALGTLCVIDQVARQLNSEQVDALCALGREVMVHLELRRKRGGN